MRYMTCFSLFTLLLALLNGCAATTPVATATSIPFPTDTSQPSQTPTSTPTEAPTLTLTPRIPMIEVGGIQVPDPKVSNPEFLNLNSPDSSIVQFANAFGVKSEDVGDLKPQLLTGADGKQFAVLTTRNLAATTDFDESGIPLLIAEKGTNGEWMWSDNIVKIPADGKGIYVGVSINQNMLLNPQYAQKTLQFIEATPEGAFNMSVIHPSQRVYRFSQADYEVNYAIKNGMAATGQLTWGKDPSFLVNLDQATATQEYKDYIKKVAEHFSGRINEWRFNEYGFEDALLNKIGSNYLDIGIQTLLDTTPNATVVVNFFANNTPGQGRNIVGYRGDYIFSKILDLQKKFPNTHFVYGNQAHLYGNGPHDPNIKSLLGPYAS